MVVETVPSGRTIVTYEGAFEGSIAMGDGRFVALGKAAALPEVETVVDATDRIVMPGVVDPYVHIDETDVQVGTYNPRPGPWRSAASRRSSTSPGRTAATSTT